MSYSVMPGIEYNLGLVPSFIFINTTDTLSTILTTGYLNGDSTVAYSNNLMAFVTSTDKGAVLLAISVAGSVISLINPYANPPTIYSSPNFTSITTATQLSSTREAYVNYVFPTSLTSLLTAQSLTATLQYADNSGMSTNLITVNVDVNGCSGLLNLTLSGRLQVSGRIPAGKYRRVSLSQSGGGTVPTTISSSQEVLL